MRAHFTPQAEIDLEEIGDYVALDNPRRAVSFVREMRQHCERIAGGPHHYVVRPDLGETIRICAHAARAMLEGTALPDLYSRYYRWWFYLGWPAFTGVLFIFYLMVARPAI